jgi:hypothetical protein
MDLNCGNIVVHNTHFCLPHQLWIRFDLVRVLVLAGLDRLRHLLVAVSRGNTPSSSKDKGRHGGRSVLA